MRVFLVGDSGGVAFIIQAETVLRDVAKEMTLLRLEGNRQQHTGFETL